MATDAAAAARPADGAASTPAAGPVREARPEALPGSAPAPASSPASPAPAPAAASPAPAASAPAAPPEAGGATGVAGGPPAMGPPPARRHGVAARSEEAAPAKGAPSEREAAAPSPGRGALPETAADVERTFACDGGPLRVRAWRDDAGRVRRVVRELWAPGGVRTVVLGYDGGGRLVEARLVAPGPGGRDTLSEAEVSRDPETAIRGARCP